MHRLQVITYVVFGSLCLLQLMNILQTPGKPLLLEGDYDRENAPSENDFMAADKAEESEGLHTGKELPPESTAKWSHVLLPSGSLISHQEQILQLQNSYENIKMNPNDTLEPEDVAQGNLDPEEHTRDTVHQRPADTDPPPHTHRNILVTSIGRSGSSFFGELLASQGNNMYFYEPIRALGRKSNLSEETIRAELLKTFHCKIRGGVLNIGKSPYINVKHKYIYGKTRAEVRLPKVIELCKKEPLRILKTIRTRLKWTKELLDDKDLNLKVIHLVRDPRGSSKSMDHLKWNQSPSFICNNILKDLQEREEMEALYPDRYFFIKYEDLCRDPYGQTRAIFRFLRGEVKGHNKYSAHLSQRDIPSFQEATNGNTTHSRLIKTDDNVISASDKETTRFDPGLYSDLPEGVLSYLQSHTHVNIFTKKSPWTTIRDTSSVYQKWRQMITQEELTRVETDCRQVIKILNHKLFGTVKSARNLTISLFSESKILD